MRALAVLVVLLLAGCARGAEPDPKQPAGAEVGDLHVEVQSSGFAVRGARVSVLGTDQFGDTDAKGRLRLVLPAGSYEVSVQTANFLPGGVTVDIVAGRTTNVTVELRLDPSKPENPHLHDLWRGAQTYTMMDATIDTTEPEPSQPPLTAADGFVGYNVLRPNGLSPADNTFFIPVVEDPARPAIVLPGTKNMTITADWDPAQVGFRTLAIRYDPPNDDARTTDPIAPGGSVTIDVPPTWWDDGHRTFTRWYLRGVHDNGPGAQWQPVVPMEGPVAIKIVLAKGEMQLDAAHPDHWAGANERVLREFEGQPGGSPIGIGQRSPKDGLRLDPDRVVPPDASMMRIEFRWTHVTADQVVPREDYDLTWRTAGQNPQTTTIEQFRRADAIEGSAAQQYKVYEYEISADDADSVYDTRSQWLFVPWISDLPEDHYQVTGRTYFDMHVTVYK